MKSALRYLRVNLQGTMLREQKLVKQKIQKPPITEAFNFIGLVSAAADKNS
jgi:hypothetical protein